VHDIQRVTETRPTVPQSFWFLGLTLDTICAGQTPGQGSVKQSRWNVKASQLLKAAACLISILCADSR
jgi:hypothetical protein